jgi:WD40 repeat protein
MTETTKDMPSVIDRTTRFEAGARVAAIHPLGTAPLFILDDEAALLGEGEGLRIGLPGVILSSAERDGRLVAGTDGGLVLDLASGAPEPVSTDPKRRWIDKVALSPDGAVAWSAGKTVFVRRGSDKTDTLDLPSAAGGLAFAPKGLRLGIARYNGATLWYPGTKAKPDELDWKGSHLGILWSPDGKFIVTTMQEPQLHGWRVADGAHMRMSGYPGRVKSFGFSADGKWLASSGADMAIMWPYQSKDGPMGKQPKMLAPYDKRVTVVAPHPRQEVLAVGFEDGLVLMVRIGDGAEILARKPDKVAMSALGWVHDGKTLAYGTDAGEAGRIDL